MSSLLARFLLRNDNLCSKRCSTRLRTVSTGVSESVSSHQDPLLSSPTGWSHCVLVIYAGDDNTSTRVEPSDKELQEFVVPQLAIEVTLNGASVPCGNESLALYDGLHINVPNGSSQPAPLIGLLSKQLLSESTNGSTFYALSGIVTVLMPVFADNTHGVILSHRTVPCSHCPSPSRSCTHAGVRGIDCSGLDPTNAQCQGCSAANCSRVCATHLRFWEVL